MIKDSTILVIGSGQIGRSSCLQILKRKPKTLILHTLTAEESEDSIKWLEKYNPNCSTELISSSGDVLVAFPGKDEDSVMAEINYRFGTLTTELYQSSQLWKLIDKHRPTMIVDGINTATVVGFGHDPYTSSRELHQVLKSNILPDSDQINTLIKNNLLSEAIPQLTRFIQVLYMAMIEFNVKTYVKISTSGLGGMGFNLKYTHGDLDEPGCSPRLLGKVAATGIFNQLLWTLSHTEGLDIKIVIPTTLVGWEGITTELSTNWKKSATGIPMVDCEEPLDLNDETIFNTHKPTELGENLSMVAVDSGENGYYAIGDMTTITTLGQMGCITKEEVALAVVESLEGSTRWDICTALDSASIGPSFNAAFERQTILDKMRKMEDKLKTRSVSIGNLGPAVTKLLWELEILRSICPSLTNIANGSADQMAMDAENLILNLDADLRQKILSIKMPILLDGNRILLGAGWHFPQDQQPQNIRDNIEIWAREGWVDLRSQRMAHWQSEIRKVIDFVEEGTKSPNVILQRNWQYISIDEEFNIGEVLGLLYSLNGGDRKL